MTTEHQHEAWQVRPVDAAAPKPGDGYYCAACGDRVRWIDSDRSGPATDGQWVTIPKPQMAEIRVDDLAILIACVSDEAIVHGTGVREAVKRVAEQMSKAQPPAAQEPTSQASWGEGSTLAYPVDEDGEAIRPDRCTSVSLSRKRCVLKAGHDVSHRAVNHTTWPHEPLTLEAPEYDTPKTSTLAQGSKRIVEGIRARQEAAREARTETPRYGHGEGDIVYDDEPTTAEIDDILGIEHEEPETKPDTYARSLLSGHANEGVVQIKVLTCEQCGALVGHRATHDAWHEGPSIEAMEGQIDGLVKTMRENGQHITCGVIMPDRSDHPCIRNPGHVGDHIDRTQTYWRNEG